MKQYTVIRFVRPILALVITGLSYAFMFSLLYREIPKENINTVNLVVGFLLGITASVGSYYFGTTKDKSDNEQVQRNGIQKMPLNELLSKVKDASLIMSERMEWLKKLKEQYPEYANVKIDDIV